MATTRKQLIYRLSFILEFEKDLSVDLLELSYVRLLHMLSHHPDFGDDLESLQLFAKYIEFFLETVSSSENISYLYIVSGQLKVVRDVLSETSDVSLPSFFYALCRLLDKSRLSLPRVFMC
jgi:hypothetical protein